MDKNIFEILTDNALNERLDSILLKDDEYQKVQDEIRNSASKFDELDLSKEQRLIVDRFISSHIKSGCCYGRIAYKCGMRDCVSLLLNMGLIKDGKEEGVV